MKRFFYRPYYADPDNSASVFDRSRKNHLGEPWCIDSAVTYEQAEAKVRRLNDECSREFVGNI